MIQLVPNPEQTGVFEIGGDWTVELYADGSALFLNGPQDHILDMSPSTMARLRAILATSQTGLEFE